MDKDKIETFQGILQDIHRDEHYITDLDKKQDYIQFCIDKLYDKIVDTLKEDTSEEEVDQLDDEQLSGLIVMNFVENQDTWFTELQEMIEPEDIAEFIEEDQFEELKQQLEMESEENDEEETTDIVPDEPPDEPIESDDIETEESEESEDDTEEPIDEQCKKTIKEDLLVDMGNGFQGNQQKKLKQIVIDENDLFDIQEMIIEIGEHLKEEIEQSIGDKNTELEEEEESDTNDGEDKSDTKKEKKDKEEEEEEESDKDEITEQSWENDTNDLRRDIALHIATMILQGDTPDVALDDARKVFDQQPIDEIIQQYDVQKVWANTKTLDELQQMNG